MNSFISILRPVNCLMAAFAVSIGGRIAGSSMTDPGIVFASLAAFLICGGGNTMNDFFDYEIDLINNPKRPLPSKKMTREHAKTYALTLFSIGVLISTFINVPSFLLALFNAGLLYLYAYSIKKMGGIRKNLTVSYLVASPFLFGGFAAGNPSITLLLVLMALFINAAREIVKDVEDYEGDLEHLESLPVRFGFKISGNIVMIFILASIALSPLPYMGGLVNIAYLYVMLLGDIILFYCVVKTVESPKDNAPTVQRLMKIAMALALLGFFIGTS